MIHLAICDDDAAIIEEIQTYIYRMGSKQIDYDVFHDTEYLLKYQKLNVNYEVKSTGILTYVYSREQCGWSKAKASVLRCWPDNNAYIRPPNLSFLGRRRLRTDNL